MIEKAVCANLEKKFLDEGILTKEDIAFLISEEDLFVLVSKIIKSLVTIRKIARIEGGDYALTLTDIEILFSDHALLVSAISTMKALIMAKRGK